MGFTPSLTRDFVFQLHVGHLAPRRQTHATRPVGRIQLPVSGPRTQTDGHYCETLTAGYSYRCLDHREGGGGGERARRLACTAVMMSWTHAGT